MFSLYTDMDTRSSTCFLAHGIKDQQQHFQMMMMAEEIVRVIVDQTLNRILIEAGAFVKVSHGSPSTNEQ